MTYAQRTPLPGTPAADPFAAADAAQRELLQSVVETARAIFDARASSIFLHDAAADEVVFEAVSGEGEEHLVGTRFPTGRGVVGYVLASGEAMVLDDMRGPGPFARDLAESTGYVPDSLMAAPLAHTEGVLGVLEVLDPGERSRASLPELELLALFARQAAVALHVSAAHRAALTESAGGAPGGGRGDRRERGRELIAELTLLLEQTSAPEV